jgi:hypothetical protein
MYEFSPGMEDIFTLYKKNTKERIMANFPPFSWGT